MELVLKFIDIFLHIDKHLGEIIQAYGTWTYSILFLIVFCETGLVVTPFLPGDSLLFAAGAFAAQGAMDLRILVVLLIIAAVIGDAVNYHIGKMIGPRAFANENSRFFKKEHLDDIRAHAVRVLQLLGGYIRHLESKPDKRRRERRQVKRRDGQGDSEQELTN